MANRLIRSFNAAAALGIAVVPFAAAQADKSEVKTSGTFNSQVSACANAMASADRAFYEPSRQTKSIGACTCEQTGVDQYAEGGPKPTFVCAVRVDVNDK